jgi:3-oxoadipate enol-lactonase
MPFLPVRDIRIYYELRGSGPRLFFISGTGGDLRRKPNIFDSPLSRHFEILAFDQRGLGQTSKPDIPYTVADYANDASGLLEALGWERCAVMGVSFGGMVAQELALRFPGRVERLVLACTSSGGAGGASYPLHELSDLSLEEYARRIVILSDSRRTPDWQERHRSEFQGLIDFTLAGLQIGGDEPGHRAGARRQIEARIGHDTFERLPGLEMPVYTVGGRYDGIALPANLQALAARIPGAGLELFEGGHLFFLQDPRAFERIKAFLEGTMENSILGR